MHKLTNSAFWVISFLTLGCSAHLDGNIDKSSSSGVRSFQQQVLDERQELQDKNAVSQFSQLHYQPIEQAKTWLQIGVDNQVFAFDSGKSYIGAYLINPQRLGHSVSVLSPLDFTVFIPSVMILDEQFRVVKVIDSTQFTYDGGQSSGQNYRGSFTLPEGYKSLYMLVFSKQKDYVGNTRIDEELLLNSMRYDRVSEVGKFSRSIIPHSPVGRLQFNFEADENSAAAVNSPAVKPQFCEKNRTPSIMSEQEYYQHIRQAVAEKKYEEAIFFIRTAECAGYKKGRDVFFAEIEVSDVPE
ncbi:MAG: MalM family protein [Aeromonadaceae bacterium]